MHFTLVNACKRFRPVRIALVASLTVLISGWTCTAIVSFNSCPGVAPQPRIASLSPDAISGSTQSVLLIVNGSGFVPQSQILWNGSALQTTVTDSGHVQATITQQTFDSLGGSAGGTVQISVMSPGSAHIVGCSDGGTSAALILVIN